MITNREKGLTNIYADLAKLSETERRKALVTEVGVYSSKEMDQDQFEHSMAVLERILWDRVSSGAVTDPRICRTCVRPLTRQPSGVGVCPEGCERRKVYAWSRTYWRSKLPAEGLASTRQVHKLRELWSILQDFLPESGRNGSYLIGIIEASDPGRSVDFDPDGLRLDTLSSRQAHRTIEALKDRLDHAVK